MVFFIVKVGLFKGNLTCNSNVILKYSIAVDSEILHGKFGSFLSRCARIALWEYQRQLWDADCADPFRQRMAYRLEEIPIAERKDSTAMRAIPSHEAHFHRYGHIGVLFLDLWSSRALENGSFDENANIINAKQWQFILELKKQFILLSY